MPENTVKSFAKRSGESISTIEGYWSDAKKVVDDKYPDVDNGSDRYFALVTAIVKRMAGIEDRKVESREVTTTTTMNGIIREAMKKSIKNPFTEKAGITFINKAVFIEIIESVTGSDVEKIKRSGDNSFYILFDSGKTYRSKVNQIQFIYGDYDRKTPIYVTEYVKNGLHELKFNGKVIIK